MIGALLVAAAVGKGAALVPAAVQSAIVLERRGAADGVRALLSAASPYAAGLSPREIGAMLQAQVAVDLLAEDRSAGLGDGARALVLLDGAIGLSAPVSDARAAKRTLAAWLKSDARRARAGELRGGRLLTASGRRAKTLLALLRRPGTTLSGVPALRPALARAATPLWLYLRGHDPLRASVFAIEARADGLTLRGLVLPAREGALLAATAAPRCEPGRLGCVSVAPGELGRAMLLLAVDESIGRAFAPANRAVAARTLTAIVRSLEGAVLRLDGLDARALAGAADSIWAVQWSASATPSDVEPATLHGSGPVCVQREGTVAQVSSPCGSAPAIEPGDAPLAVTLDVAAAEGALAHLTPLDALRGEVAAVAYGAHLLYGRLLKRAGPLTIRGSPANDVPDAAELELRLPLHLPE